MTTVDSLIKYFGEENQNNEENKVNFDNNTNENNSTNQGVKFGLLNEIIDGDNTFSSNFEINKILNKNISIYNNVNKNEKQEKEKEKKENNIEKKSEDEKEDIHKDIININKEGQLLVSDILSYDAHNKLNENNINNDIQDNQEKGINKEENIKEEYERERSYSFRPKKLPSTPNLNTKEKIKINEFKLDKEKEEIKSIETNNISDNIDIFTETIPTKIENNENYLISMSNNNHNNINKNENKNDIEKNEENNDESEDNTFKEEEDFLNEEELKKKKKEEKKEDNVVDIIEERKEEEEEDNDEKNNINNENDEEAQRKYLEAQDKKKNLKKMREEMNIRASTLKESIEQKKKLLEKMNKEKLEKKNEEEKNNKNIDNNNNNNEKIKEVKEVKNTKEVKEIKEIKKENKNDISKNNKKYREKINLKKKQLSNTVFNRLYNNDKKKEKEKEKEKIIINYNEKITEKNNKNKNKVKALKKKIDTIVINDNSSEGNHMLNNSQNINNQFPMINNLKKEIKNNPPKNHHEKNTNQNNDSKSFIQKYIAELKNANSNTSKKLDQLNKPIIFDDTQYETYSFRPEINQKSKDLCKKKFQKRKNSSPTKKPEFYNTYIENRRLKAPIGELLYEDASNKKQKLENICITEKINAKKDGNKSFISEGSRNLLLKKNELKLNEIVEKYSRKNGGKLSIINLIQILWEIHILRDLLKNSSKSVEELDFNYVKTIVEEISSKKNIKGTRDMDEIEFVEQFWIKINPYYENEKDFIEKEKLNKFLKLLFSLNEHTEINKTIQTVESFLKNINKNEVNIKTENKEKKEIQNNNDNHENDEKENNNNLNNEKNLEVKENQENIETQEKKDNENKDNINNENQIEIKENKENENEENINNQNNIENKEINNENMEKEENNNEIKKEEIMEIDKNNNKKNNIKKYISLLRKKEFEKNEIWHFSKFLKIFFELKKLLSKYLSSKKDKIMENIIKEREKELTFQPDFNATSSYFRKKNKNEDLLNTSINSNITNKTNKTNKKKHDFNKLYEEFMMKKQMHERALMILRENREKREIKMCTDRPKINNNYKIKNRKKTPEKGCTRNEFLYNLNKDILNRKKEKFLEKENEYNNKEKYPFRPNISNNDSLMNKSFMEGPKKKPRGSEEYIKRNRSVIQFKRRERDKELNRTIGSNYEKLIRQKFNLPKIKDLEPNTNIHQQKEVENQNNNKEIINKENIQENKKENNDDEDPYFTILVKTAKGTKPLKIYINNNPIEAANKFCDENNIKKVTRDNIIQKIKELKKVYKELAVQENQK